ncbi:MAG: hypothetical protein CM15mP103_09920 [Gammaproteobacteria bacterium]|nr:MAG: hypothetical protein CM15mP103_09920 [Gammaproteobacteria bacterium]
MALYTVPNPRRARWRASDAILAKLANETWGDDGAWVTDGGGGTAWDSLSMTRSMIRS